LYFTNGNPKEEHWIHWSDINDFSLLDEKLSEFMEENISQYCFSIFPYPKIP